MKEKEYHLVQACKAYVLLQAPFTERMYKTFYSGREGGEKEKGKEKRKGKNITAKIEGNHERYTLLLSQRCFLRTSFSGRVKLPVWEPN